MQNQEDSSKIDELNKDLYSRNAPEIKAKRRLRFQKQTPTEIREDWEHAEIPTEDVELNKEYKDNSMSLFTKILIASVVFFVLALGVGAFLFFKGNNIVSAKNVDITVNSPVSVSGGDPITFDIQVLNQNNIKLENVNMTVEFPSGTAEFEDNTVELKKFQDTLPDIEPGGIAQRSVYAVLYGEENSKKEIKILVEYRVKGSNATFRKEKMVEVLISSSPISISVSSFEEINSGQEFEMTININSSSKEVIRNLLLKSVYPFGYTFISSDLKTSSSNNTWFIGDMPPGSKKSFKIRGKLEGQDDEARVFRFMIGSNNNNLIGTEYTSVSKEVNIRKPFMTVGVALDGDSENQQYVARFNDRVRVDVTYFNNLTTSIIDAEIRVKLDGSAFDKGSVSPENGLYRSEDSEIVWNGITTPDLREIGAGESGRVVFYVTPRDLSTTLKSITNPDFRIDISVRGKRNSENNVPENLTSTAQRIVKISSDVYLAGQVVRSSGPFENSGPIPPQAEKETTYTIFWTIDNTTSNISNVQVQSSLPPYVKWLGKVSSGENMIYNPTDGTLVWNAGSLGTHTLNTSRRRQVAFQVALKPSITQAGQIPILINSSYLVASDDFTGETLRSNLGELNTRFSADSTFREGDEKVVQ